MAATSMLAVGCTMENADVPAGFKGGNIFACLQTAETRTWIDTCYWKRAHTDKSA